MNNAVTNLVAEINASSSGFDKSACLKMSDMIKALGYSASLRRNTQGEWGLIVTGCTAKGGASDVLLISKPSHLHGLVVSV